MNLYDKANLLWYSVVVICLTMLSCVAMAKDIDWKNLNRAKDNYCSTPIHFDWYEDANWKWCKVHDNRIGVNGINNKPLADKLMLEDCKKHSEFIQPFKFINCHIAYHYVKWFH